MPTLRSTQLQASDPLVLRRPSNVLLAFVVAAGVGGLVLALNMVAGSAIDGWWPPNPVDAFLSTVAIGAVACVIVEVLVLLPLVVGYRAKRWRWLNGVTGTAMGTLIGALPAFLITVQPNGDGTSELLGYYHQGMVTALGLAHAARNAVSFGMTGFASALAFRLLAVRRATAGS